MTAGTLQLQLDLTRLGHLRLLEDVRNRRERGLLMTVLVEEAHVVIPEIRSLVDHRALQIGDIAKTAEGIAQLESLDLARDAVLATLHLVFRVTARVAEFAQPHR